MSHVGRMVLWLAHLVVAQAVLWPIHVPCGEVREELEADYNSEPLAIGFNPKYPVELLMQMSADQITIALGGELDPGLIRPLTGDDYLGTGSSTVASYRGRTGGFLAGSCRPWGEWLSGLPVAPVVPWLVHVPCGTRGSPSLVGRVGVRAGRCPGEGAPGLRHARLRRPAQHAPVARSHARRSRPRAPLA